MEELKEKVDTLWACTIKKMDVDVLNQKIKFDLVSIEENYQENHTVEIRDYISFMWFDGHKCDRKIEPDNDYMFKNYDYYEMTSISINNIKLSTDDRWLKQYNLDYNIGIEIWESAILIKTDKIIIDDIEYVIGEQTEQ